MRRFLLALVPLTLAVPLACSHASDAVDSAESAHTEGEYVLSNNVFQWASVDYKDLDPFATHGAPAASDTHALATRMHRWSNRIDGLVRTEASHRLREQLKAPRPTVKISITGDDMSAWTAPVEGCIGVGTAPGHAQHMTNSLEDSNFAAFSPERLEGTNLLKPKHPAHWPSADEFVRMMGGLGGACHAAWNDAGDALTNDCNLGSSTYFHAGVLAVTPYVHLSAPLLASIDEKAAVFALAHELGHYYRAHTSSLVKNKYSFWYDDDRSQSGRPVPAADQSNLENAFRKIDGAPKPVGGPSLDSHFHARTRAFVVRSASTLAGHTEPGCAEAIAAGGAWTTEFLTSAAPSDGARQHYLDYERKLVACAANVRLTADARRTLQSDATMQLRVAVPDTVQTLGEALDGADAEVRKLDVRVKELADHLAQNRIGFYTTEQEADELAMEIATKLGMSAEDVMSAWERTSAALEDFQQKRTGSPGLAPGELSAAQCAALRRKDFSETDADGNKTPVYVQMGDISDPHHAHCYRLYNLWREARAHHYVPVGTFTPPAQPWSDMQDAAKVLAGWSAPTPTPAPASDGGDAGTIPSGDAGTTDPNASDPTPSSDPAQDPSQDPAQDPGQDPSEDPSSTAKPAAKKASAGGCSVGGSSTDGTTSIGGALVALGAVFARRRNKRAR